MNPIPIETHKKEFIFSCNHFQGFKSLVLLDYFEELSLENIIEFVKKDLENHLLEYNFENLHEKFKEKNFHIHNETLETILHKSSNEPIYICSHE
jgi:hypothetical protein